MNDEAILNSVKALMLKYKMSAEVVLTFADFGCRWVHYQEPLRRPLPELLDFHEVSDMDVSSLPEWTRPIIEPGSEFLMQKWSDGMIVRKLRDRKKAVVALDIRGTQK